MLDITANTPIRRKIDVLCAEVDGETIMMDAEKGFYYGIKAIGSDIWHRLAEPVTPARLTADMVDAYDGAPAEIERDVLAFLGQLVEQELVELGRPAVP